MSNNISSLQVIFVNLQFLIITCTRHVQIGSIACW